ncbi:hypothetical protein IQ07DRAFT_587619 [Pyrenochaeta sp. DS3sAY3a]|nr:hypothetical protein IQ07DRAFT_587619 [Pyrenochaeta sp. DS3sAY3a]
MHSLFTHPLPAASHHSPRLPLHHLHSHSSYVHPAQLRSDSSTATLGPAHLLHPRPPAHARCLPARPSTTGRCAALPAAHHRRQPPPYAAPAPGAADDLTWLLGSPWALHGVCCGPVSLLINC